jgi:hypothetical protein
MHHIQFDFGRRGKERRGRDGMVESGLGSTGYYGFRLGPKFSPKVETEFKLDSDYGAQKFDVLVPFFNFYLFYL